MALASVREGLHTTRTLNTSTLMPPPRDAGRSAARRAARASSFTFSSREEVTSPPGGTRFLHNFEERLTELPHPRW